MASDEAHQTRDDAGCRIQVLVYMDDINIYTKGIINVFNGNTKQMPKEFMRKLMQVFQQAMEWWRRS